MSCTPYDMPVTSHLLLPLLPTTTECTNPWAFCNFSLTSENTTAKLQLLAMAAAAAAAVVADGAPVVIVTVHVPKSSCSQTWLVHMSESELLHPGPPAGHWSELLPETLPPGTCAGRSILHGAERKACIL